MEEERPHAQPSVAQPIRKECPSHEGNVALFACFFVLPCFLSGAASLLPRTGFTPEPTWAIPAFAWPWPTSSRWAQIRRLPRSRLSSTPRLYSDLTNAGIFDMVSKSLAPQAMPGSPQEIALSQWSAAPANASMVAFGALSATNGRLIVYGWLDDASNTDQPAGAGAAIQRGRLGRDGAHHCASFRRRYHQPPRRRHQRHRGDQDLFCECAHRIERDLGDGLRRPESARGHAPGHHLAFAARFAG